MKGVDVKREDLVKETNAILAARCGSDRSEIDEELMRRLEKDLRQLAEGYRRQFRDLDILQTTMLVNDGFMGALRQTRTRWKGREHFLAIAATCMRRVAWDLGRRERAKKRPPPGQGVSLDDEPVAAKAVDVDELLTVHQLLKKLETRDPRAANVLRMRHLCGFDVSEVAEEMDLSYSAVKELDAFAKAWMRRELKAGGPARSGKGDAGE